MTSQPQDTEALFTKKLPIAIVVLVFTIVNMVLIGTIIGVHHYTPTPLFYTNNVPPIVYAACLLVFAIIGKNKGKENRIMSFIFGIATLGLSAGLIIDRATKIGTSIENIVDAAALIPSLPIYVVDLVLRIAVLAFVVLVIVFSILSIVNSVGIIKENVPSSGSASVGPASSSFVAQPTMASTPPPASSSIPKAKFCASCGTPLEADAAFCNKCGAKA